MADAQEPLPDLVLTQAVLDRDAATREEPGVIGRLLGSSATKVLEVRRGRAHVSTVEGGGLRLGLRSPSAEDERWAAEGGLMVYLGRLDGVEIVAAIRPDRSTDGGDDGVTLRDVGLALPSGDVAVFTTAVALANWHERHPRCPQCGAPTVPEQAGWVRRCEADESVHFPRTDPAVIMAVVDADDRILLARGPRWTGPHRSVLAGFVEPGESFEAAVARETLEESGVVVDEVSYLGNQPWPFPASLMIGFVARARTTDLTPQAGEIEEIAWYSRTEVEHGLAAGTLALPGRLSIARALIEHWYGGPLPVAEEAS